MAEGRPVFGPRGDLPLTDDAKRALLAGWDRASGDAELVCERLRVELASRSAGLVGEGLADRTILIVGCGSVGSYAAEQLARSGVGRLVLVDPDRVEASNLSRAMFLVVDIGRTKVEALAGHLLNVNPSISVDCHADGVGAITDAALGALVDGSDVVVAATDDPIAQLQLARHAQRAGRPALFVGLTAGARGGELVMMLPGTTPCYRCATSIRHARDEVPGLSRETDYGTGRLEGVVALGVDVQHVAGVAVKFALSLTLREGNGELSAFATAVLDRGISYLTFSMSEDYWFYPAYFAQLGGQFGYQSVGLAVEADPECPICGPNADLAVLSEPAAADLADLREQLSGLD